MSPGHTEPWSLELVRHARGSRDPAWLYDEHFAVMVTVLIGGVVLKLVSGLSPWLWVGVAVPALIYCYANLQDACRVRRCRKAMQAAGGAGAGTAAHVVGETSVGGMAGGPGRPAAARSRLHVVGNAAEVEALRDEPSGAYPYQRAVSAWRTVMGLMALIVAVRHLLHFPGTKIDLTWATWPLAGLLALLVLARSMVYSWVEVRPGWLQVRPAGVLRVLGRPVREFDLTRAEVRVDFKERVLEVRDADRPLRISLLSTWRPHELAYHVLHAAAGRVV